MKIVSATNNKGKLREIKAILFDFEIYSMEEVGIDVDVVEDQDTFLDNAKKKATEIYDLVQMPVIADDSGLCIDYLDGFPGVYSKRFLDDTDHEATDIERNSFIIEKLRDVDYDDKKCSFNCVIVYYDGVEYIIGNGKFNGHIANNMRGENGFGFDSVFELENGKTMAELSSDEKNLISARKLALEDLLKQLNKKQSS